MVTSGEMGVLFTDIEGSTALLRRARDVFTAVLVRHFELLEGAVATHGGTTISTDGDALAAVFPDSRRALAAAVDAQRALASEPWPNELVVAVRMAVHRGPVTNDAGVYVGMALHQTARVVDAAHGGQIVCTSAVVADAEADGQGVDFVDLGRFTLRDFTTPEPLYQIAGDGLRPTFPPLRARPALQHNLPQARGQMLGRDVELSDLRKLLETERLVTIVGPGGTGKTTLALDAGRAAVAEFPDGVWAAFLAPVDDAAEVWRAVAAAVGVTEQPTKALADLVVGHLAERNALLLIDNCEHVVDAVAEVADRLLDSCPQICVMTTSRIALRTRGERRYFLGALDLPPEDVTSPETLADVPSVALFVERARQARPSFVFDAQTAPSVAAIVRRLDGVPLPIELAAARVRSSTPAQIERRLDKALDLLTGGNRTDARRQQTVRALVDWSADLLSPTDAVVYRRLSVFRGGCDLEAAQFVCAADDLDEFNVTDALDSLVDASLLVVVNGDDGEARYRMLEVVRQHAEELLAEAGEESATRDQHLRHFLSVDARMSEADSPRELAAAFAADVANFDAALSWMLEDECGVAPAVPLALRRWELRSGRLERSVQWSRVALERFGETHPHFATQLLTHLSTYEQFAGRHDTSVDVARQAVRLADERAPEAAIATRVRLAEALSRRRGTEAESLEVIDKTLAMGDVGDKRAWLLLLRAWGRKAIHDPMAAAALEEALVAAEADGDEHVFAIASQTLARDLLSDGRAHDSRRVALEALATFEARADFESAARVRFNLAMVDEALGDFDIALAELRIATDALVEAQSWDMAILALRQMARVSVVAGDLRGAIDALHEAREVAEHVGGVLPRFVTTNLVALHAARGDIRQATVARATLRTMGDEQASSDVFDHFSDAILSVASGDGLMASQHIDALLSIGFGEAAIGVTVRAAELVDPKMAAAFGEYLRARRSATPDVVDAIAAQQADRALTTLDPDAAADAVALGASLDEPGALAIARSVLEKLSREPPSIA